jgi:hypothetical protein
VAFGMSVTFRLMLALSLAGVLVALLAWALA